MSNFGNICLLVYSIFDDFDLFCWILLNNNFWQVGFGILLPDSIVPNHAKMSKKS